MKRVLFALLLLLSPAGCGQPLHAEAESPHSIASPRIHPGDVVRLRSGGPAMTVQGIDLNGSDVVCAWFDETGKLHNGDFREAALEIVPVTGGKK